MQLVTTFDDVLLAQYSERESPPVFTIYWENCGEYYPEKNWIDFGGVILGWWLVACRHLKKNSSCDLMFMDGPYRMKAFNSSNETFIRCRNLGGTDYQWVTSYETLASEIRKTANHVSRHLQALSLYPEICSSLDDGIANLNK